jgi:uncharacterized protein YdhG (YjbR/CyaY superfamily)
MLSLMRETHEGNGMPKTTKAADAEQNFTAEERAAIKERAKETRAAKKATAGADAEAEVLAKIAEFDEKDRVMGEWVHETVRAAAPELAPRLWYGMPAYYQDGKLLCFFQPSAKFKTRYGILGFGDQAALDEGTMWPTYYALMTVNDEDAKRIGELVARAAA